MHVLSMPMYMCICMYMVMLLYSTCSMSNVRVRSTAPGPDLISEVVGTALLPVATEDMLRPRAAQGRQGRPSAVECHHLTQVL